VSELQNEIRRVLAGGAEAFARVFRARRVTTAVNGRVVQNG
jgi:hypothetical protein